jgi:DNA-3-methyladenine glycosylase II
MDPYQQAADYLAAQDPVLAPVIKRAGAPTFRAHRNYYQALVDSIISQQLSVKAAATIEQRFCALFGRAKGDFPPPEKILSKTVDELRAAGLSRSKASYVYDLAQRITDGSVQFEHLERLSNGEIINELVAVKGIGEWTAHMFLIFCMGRLDVLATGDLGVRNGIQKLYGLRSIPMPDQVTKIAKRNHWHPYESAACWYIWHSLDNKPAV